jgi:hypothetical protein
MDAEAIAGVVETWAEQYAELAAIPLVGHVQIFENRGAMMGASNPHPHGQIWANERLPNEPAKELAGSAPTRRTARACCATTSRPSSRCANGSSATTRTARLATMKGATQGRAARDARIGEFPLTGMARRPYAPEATPPTRPSASSEPTASTPS